MADYPDKTSERYVRDSTYRVEPTAESTGSMWFILGGIVVALVVLFAIFYGGGDSVAPTDGSSPVTIENNEITPAPAPDTTAPADPLMPAPDATAPPADSAAPPADAAAPADAPAPADAAAPPADATAPAPAEPETAPTAPAAGN